MPVTSKQFSPRLSLPSAMGTATVLFHFLFCMLLSSVLLSNPLTGGGFGESGGLCQCHSRSL